MQRTRSIVESWILIVVTTFVAAVVGWWGTLPFLGATISATDYLSSAQVYGLGATILLSIVAHLRRNRGSGLAQIVALFLSGWLIILATRSWLTAVSLPVDGTVDPSLASVVLSGPWMWLGLAALFAGIGRIRHRD